MRHGLLGLKVTQLGHLTACRRTSSVSVPMVGGHGAGFLLVGMRAAPLLPPASPRAALASIPLASFLDASETIKGLHGADSSAIGLLIAAQKQVCVR